MQRGMQRAVPLLGVAQPPSQKPEAFVQAAPNLGRRHRTDARRGKFDGKRDAVASADFAHGRGGLEPMPSRHSLSLVLSPHKHRPAPDNRPHRPNVLDGLVGDADDVRRKHDEIGELSDLDRAGAIFRKRIVGGR